MARLSHIFGDYRRQGSMCRASSASSARAQKCPVWVKLRSHGSEMVRPVYLQQRTYLISVATAVECHDRHLIRSSCTVNGHSMTLSANASREDAYDEPAATIGTSGSGRQRAARWAHSST
jgi:hypothetical protein